MPQMLLLIIISEG